MPSVTQGTPVRQPLRNLNHSHVRTPGRRSLLVTSPPLMKLANDDDEERLQRRSSIKLQHRISNIVVANRSSIAEHSELSESKMQDHFQTCLRMFTQNKINTKNAWSLQIIEFMRKLVDREFSSGESIQLASTSLDISSKVYGLRVDDIHQDILKLATTMGRISLEAGTEDAAADGDDEAAETSEAEVRRQRRPRKRFSFSEEGAVTLAAKPASLEAAIAVHNTEYKLSACHRLYTLSAVRTQRFGYESLVRSRSNLPHWSPVAPALSARPTSGLVGVELPPAAGTLCPTFVDFAVDEWDVAEEQLPNRTPASSVVYDADGYAMPELDQSECPPDDDDADDDDGPLSEVEEELGGAGQRAEAAHITDMRPGTASLSTLATNGLEYSYRAPPLFSERYKLTGVWAGPVHWRVKCLRPPTSVEGGAAARCARKRPSRDADIDVCLSNADFEVYSIVGRKVNLTRAMVDTDMERLYLPPDLSITQRTTASLFLRPEIAVAAPGSLHEPDNIELSIENYEYDNPIDAEYCNRTLISAPEPTQDEDGNEDDGVPFDADVDPMNDSCADGDMVCMPNFVARAHVPYSTQAKKMDMRKLKEAILHTLVEQDSASEEAVRHVAFSRVSFCRMYETLPGQLNSRMADELSCPLAFVALLHLCNERSLELNGQEDLLDVLISSTT